MQLWWSYTHSGHGNRYCELPKLILTSQMCDVMCKIEIVSILSGISDCELFVCVCVFVCGGVGGHLKRCKTCTF